jgi:hypothetical protein
LAIDAICTAPGTTLAAPLPDAEHRNKVKNSLLNCGGNPAKALFDHVLCARRRIWNQMHSFATAAQQTP